MCKIISYVQVQVEEYLCAQGWRIAALPFILAFYNSYWRKSTDPVFNDSVLVAQGFLVLQVSQRSPVVGSVAGVGTKCQKRPNLL
jgi:hypothetical protein